MRFTKEQLIATLEAMRSAVAAADAEVAAKHHADELTYLETWRARLQEALTWDYETAKKHSFNIKGNSFAPSCPVSRMSQLNYWLHNVKISEQKRYAISSSGAYSRLHKLLMFEAPKPQAIC